MVQLAETCQERKYEVVISLRGEPRSDEFLNDLHETGAHVDITPVKMDAFSFLSHVIKLIRNQKIDIIHTHFSPSCHYVNFMGMLLGVKGRFWTKHSMSEIDTYSPVKQRVVAARQIISSLLVDKIIAVSEAVKEDYVRLGVRQEKILTIPLGIDIEKYSPNEEARNKLRREFGVDDATVLIGTVSRAEPVKGLRYLVEAMPQVIRRVPGVKALVIGGGSQLDDLKKTAIELGIHDHVIFEGVREDVPQILSAIDIFVLPSLSEGLPLALLEAMASGKACVGSKVGGIPELIEEAVTGFLVAPADSSNLAEAITRLSLDRNLRSKMGRLGMEEVAHKYSLRTQVEQLVDLYEQQMRHEQ